MSYKAINDLSMPIIVAPMFRVSGPELVIAACRSGVIGSFPAINTRTPDDLDLWLSQISRKLEQEPDVAPYAVNLVIRSESFSKELDVVRLHKVPIVISSVGSPEAVVPHIHSYGGIVLADVATLRHARKAVELGVDGLILLCAGAGGNTGWLNPFAFVRAVREFYDGLIVIAGSIMDGASIRAAEALGADMVYMGTRFIAANESLAADEYKQKLKETNIDDVMTTNEISGIPANFIRSTIKAAGLDPENLPPYDEFNKGDFRKQRWKNIWSAGQGVGAVKEILSVAQIVEQLSIEYKTSEKNRKKY